MKTYAFSVILDEPRVTEADCDALFQAGCDDATVITREQRTYVAFDREAASLEDAIRTAIADIRAAGFAAARIEMDATAVAT